jgi:hypothetical protein
MAMFLLFQGLWLAVTAIAFAVPTTLPYHDLKPEDIRSGKMFESPSPETLYQLISGYIVISILAILVCAIPIILGVRLVRRWLRRRAEGEVARTTGNAVLLLRSFADDQAKVRSDHLGARIQLRKRRLEEVVAAIVGAIGPFIGIGAPGERLPQLGAMRAYFDDDTWQQAVLDWIASSQFVVMVAGLTQWVQWELRTIIEKQALERLIVLMPPTDRQGLAARIQLLRRCFKDTSWASALDRLHPERTLVILFMSNGQMLEICGRRRDEIEYRLAILAAMRRLGTSASAEQ